MCGVLGVLSQRLPSREQLEAATYTLAHRGPDDGDVWLDSDAGIAVGHRRLAIVELSPAGHQPMRSSSGRFVLTYNGEIYNHLALRKQLFEEDCAVTFSGTSDTETLLACFEHWGIEKTLRACSGMFALGVWDRKRRRLVLARDRLGEKPLYYGWRNGAFLFASELKALARLADLGRDVDPNVLALYMQYGYVPAPYAIYPGMFKLEPGAFLTVDLTIAEAPPARLPLSVDEPDHRCPLVRYWDLGKVYAEGRAAPFASEADAIENLQDILRAAVSDQLMSDVPVGAFLSGGVDSSTVVALMREASSTPVKTFTIGFSETDFDEAKYAAAVAHHLGTEHTELYVSASDAMSVIPELPLLYSEPFADSSQIPTLLVSRLARSNVSVALSGDGGDELFGGYNRHIWTKRVWGPLYRVPYPARLMIGRMLRGVPATSWPAAARFMPGPLQVANLGEKIHKLGQRLDAVRSMDELYESLVTVWPRSVVPSAEKLGGLRDRSPWITDISAPEERMMARDTLTYLPDDILQKVDRAAMAVSLETRVPLLDRRVVAVSARTPLSMKLRNGQGKWLLRQVLAKYVPQTLTDRPKAGFAIPVGPWLRGPLRGWAEELLSEKSLNRSGLLDVSAIRQRWRDHLEGAGDAAPALWTVLMFQAWLVEGGISPGSRNVAA